MHKLQQFMNKLIILIIGQCVERYSGIQMESHGALEIICPIYLPLRLRWHCATTYVIMVVMWYAFYLQARSWRKRVYHETITATCSKTFDTDIGKQEYRSGGCQSVIGIQVFFSMVGHNVPSVFLLLFYQYSIARTRRSLTVYMHFLVTKITYSHNYLLDCKNESCRPAGSSNPSIIAAVIVSVCL